MRRGDAHPDGVDVALVASEGLSALGFSDVPQLGGEVARPRDEKLEVRGHRQGHAVPLVPSEDGFLGPRLNVPQHAEKRTEQRRLLSARLKRSGGGGGGVRGGSHQVQSPELVRISLSLRKRQQDR